VSTQNEDSVWSVEDKQSLGNLLSLYLSGRDILEAPLEGEERLRILESEWFGMKGTCEDHLV